jgi:two-component system sensor histidine kinase TctE
MVALKVSGNLPEQVIIYVAETLNKRRNRFIEIFIADLAPQLLLTLLIGGFIFKGVNRILAPLQKLTHDIAKRSPSDLSSIPETNVFEEVIILIDTINSLFNKLSDAMTAQQRFISNAAHQLRTPLAGLKLQAERAQREEKIETMRPALSQIQNSADRISHTINQLLVLARSNKIEGSHDFERFDLLKLSKTICMEWVPKALEKDISLSFETERSTVFIEGDQILLTELLANLLNNAITYGHQQGNIFVKVTQQEYPCLSIEDDGPGISEMESKKVFERFYRTAGSSGDGCGLGLAIVKEIADLHQVNLTLSRSIKGGARFELQF